MCTPTCSQGKYYEPEVYKCAQCPQMEQCAICGPSRTQCLNSDSCNEGFEWDDENPHTCKMLLTEDVLAGLGLNPNKQYFEMTDTGEQEAALITEEISGEKSSYKKDDILPINAVKTVIFETGIKIKFMQDGCN